MNDPLEAELASLKPRGLSSELEKRIATDLSSEAARWPYFVAAIASVILVTGILIGTLRPEQRDETSIRSLPNDVEADSESQPTLQVYRRAFDRSPEELDELLARHAAASRVHAFGRPSDIQTLIGESK